MSRLLESLVSRVQKLVRRRNRPFNVRITRETSEVIAGVNTKLCTLHIEFRKEVQWNGRQESLPQISVSSDQLPNAEDLLQVTEWHTNGSQSPQKTVYLNTEQTLEQLTLTIAINIQRVKNVFFDEENLNLQRSLAICNISYSVQPSTPKQIFVTGYPKAAFRGSTEEVTAEIHDSFGNLSGDRSLLTDIKVSSESLSTSSVKFISRGLFQIMLKCNKIGLAKARIECEFQPGETQYSALEFMVKCSPPSPTFSSILSEDVSTIANSAFEAGTAITFRVSVKDSFGHPILKEDKKVNIGIAFKGSQIPGSSKEISSLNCKVRDNSNIYFLTMILRKAGKRKLRLFFNNDDCTVQELTTITIKIVPSMIATIQLECPQNNANKIFVNVPFKIKLNTFDRFGNSVLFLNKENRVTIDATTKHKKSNMENKAKSKLQVDKKDGSEFCRVRFPCAGLHMLHVLLQQSTSDQDEMVATDTTDVFVTLAPFSRSKTIVQELSANLLVKAGTETKVSVKLYDIYANPVAYSDLQILNQKIPLEANFLPIHHCHCCESSVTEAENQSIYLKSTAETGLYDVLFRPLISGKRTLSITLKGESILNSTVEVDVVPSRLSNLQSELIKNGPKSAIEVNIPQTLVLTAYDAFDNIIPFNDPQHPLFFSSNLRSINPETKKLQVKDKSAYCSVTFLSLGRHTVSMLVKDCLYNVAVADQLVAYANNKTLSHISTVPEDFDGVEEYEDDEFCILEYDSECDSNVKYKTITCYGYNVKGKIIGPDHSRLNNINRTIELGADDEILEDDDIEDNLETDKTIVNVDGFPASKVLMIYGLVLACLRGQHYREQGRRFDAKRQEWKTESQRAFNDNDRRYAQECSKIKGTYSCLVSMCYKMARDEIFSFYNEGRGLQSIDLHELFAADEGKLQEFYTQLLKQKKAMQVAKQVFSHYNQQHIPR